MFDGIQMPGYEKRTLQTVQSIGPDLAMGLLGLFSEPNSNLIIRQRQPWTNGPQAF